MYNWFNSTSISDMIQNPPSCPYYRVKDIDYDWQLYRTKVRELTELNAVNLKHFELRAYKGYHVDHIVPIYYGYKNGICIHLIASEENLRMMYWKENCKKGKQLTADSKSILSKWYQN